jgi:hypothetical protein
MIRAETFKRSKRPPPYSTKNKNELGNSQSLLSPADDKSRRKGRARTVRQRAVEPVAATDIADPAMLPGEGIRRLGFDSLVVFPRIVT